MEKITFFSSETKEELRPTHANQVIELLTAQGIEKFENMNPETVERHVIEVRSRYRCRTVRKELRRIILMAQRASANNDTISINDPQIQKAA